MKLIWSNSMSRLRYFDKSTTAVFKQSLVKLTLIVALWTCAMLQISVAAGTTQKISLQRTNASLYSVISEIRELTGYDFLLNSELLKKAKPVTVNVTDVSVEEVLKRVFQGQVLTFEIMDGNTVVIHEREKGVFERAKAFFGAEQLEPQQRVIRVTVVDSLGNPLRGVSVAMKGSNLRMATNADGQFTVSITNEENTVTLTYVGMKTRTLVLNGQQQTVSVMMKYSEDTLDDVVVTGYSNIRKESFTGNSIQVSREDILKVGSRNIMETLQVFDPSFRIERNNLMGSDPNTLPEFYVRGRSGIGVKELDNTDLSQASLTNNPNLPVFIMDGYEVSAQRVYDFDPMRIKSVTILKDAAATAIYGSRAANGVIVIETIPPQPGKLRVNYNAVTSLTAPDISDYNLMDAAEKLETERLAGFFDVAPGASGGSAALREYIEKQNQVARGVNTDWLALPLQNEFNQKHTLTIEGGGEELRFGATLRHDNQNGIMKGSKRNRTGGSMTVEYRHPKLQVRNETWYDVIDAVNSPYGDFSNFATRLPYDQVRDRDGDILQNTYAWHTGIIGATARQNPLYEAQVASNRSTNGSNSIVNNLALNWKVLPHLMVRGQLSLTKTDGETENFIDPLSGRYLMNANTDYSEVGELRLSNSSLLSVNSNLFANYVNSFDDHNVNFSFGFNTRETNQTTDNALYRGFPSAEQSSPNSASKIMAKPAYREHRTRLFGTFLALNYSFKDIYLLDLSGRLDGSSEFGTEKKYAPFWSAGTGVNLHNYEFMKGQSLLSRARLTGVVGQLGKTNFQPYAAQHTYSRLSSWYRTGPGASLIYMGNPMLKWEKTNTLDIILDLGMLNDRLSLNVNWYNKLTYDLVNDVDLPLSTGFSTYKDNIGKIRNRGIELNLRADVVRTNDVLVGIWGNMAANKNVLLEVSSALQRYNALVDAQYNGYSSGGTQIAQRTRFNTPHVKYVEGASVTAKYGMQSLGINPVDGREVFMKPDGTITYEWNAGDQVIIGDPEPKLQGAFGLNMNYKGFSLFLSMLYRWGGQEYNTTLLNKVENVDLRNHNADRRVLTSRWQKPGDIAMFKDIAESQWTTRPTSRFMQDYNELVFNSVSLGYTFNREWIQSLGLNLLRLQLNTNNLGVVSSVQQERGLSYPYARTFDFTLNVGF